MSKEDQNQNGKGNTEKNITKKKDRTLSNKRDNIKKLQKYLEGTSQKENLQNWSFVEIPEHRHMDLRHGEEIYSLETV